MKKKYGSIPHMSGSSAKGDKFITLNQEKIGTECIRDRHDKVILQEKLDGSNVGIYREEDRLRLFTRNGYEIDEYNDNPVAMSFYKYMQIPLVQLRWRFLLRLGQTARCEYLAVPHGTKYKFEGSYDHLILLDIFEYNERCTYKEMMDQVERCKYGLHPVKTVFTPHIGGPISLTEAKKLLGKHGGHGAEEKIEGCIWRVERKECVDFMFKYVRKGYIQGKYL